MRTMGKKRVSEEDRGKRGIITCGESRGVGAVDAVGARLFAFQFDQAERDAWLVVDDWWFYPDYEPQSRQSWLDELPVGSIVEDRSATKKFNAKYRYLKLFNGQWLSSEFEEPLDSKYFLGHVEDGRYEIVNPGK